MCCSASRHLRMGFCRKRLFRTPRGFLWSQYSKNNYRGPSYTWLRRVHQTRWHCKWGSGWKSLIWEQETVITQLSVYLLSYMNPGSWRFSSTALIIKFATWQSSPKRKCLIHQAQLESRCWWREKFAFS